MFVGLSILMVLPIWIVRYLPFGDLPDHAGQIRAIMEFDYYRNAYEINWFTPYLLGYVLTMALATCMPVITAIKIIFGLSLVATPWSMSLCHPAARGDRYWVISAFPMAWSYSLFWGFYSCIVGTAVAMFFIVFIVAYAKRKLDLRSYLGAAGFSLLLFFAHAIPWAFSVCAAGLILFIDNDFRTSLKKFSAVLSIAPIVVYWMSLTYRGKSAHTMGSQLKYLTDKIVNQIGFFVATLGEHVDNNLYLLRVQ